MNTLYILLAQGRQERLKGCLNIPKQCLGINGKRVIQRTLDQLGSSLVNRFYVVCPDSDVWASTLANYSVAPITLAEPGLCILMGIETCLKQFVDERQLFDQFIFVLADTVFANEDARFLIEQTKSLKWPQKNIFFLSESREINHDIHINILGDIFAFGFRVDQILTILGALNDLNCRHLESDTVMSGHLRKLKEYFRRYQIPFDALVTSGYTRDIDTPEDLAKLPELEQLVMEDDNGNR